MTLARSLKEKLTRVYRYLARVRQKAWFFEYRKEAYIRVCEQQSASQKSTL